MHVNGQMKVTGAFRVTSSEVSAMLIMRAWQSQPVFASAAPTAARDASASRARRIAAQQVRQWMEHQSGVSGKSQDCKEEEDRQFSDRSKDPKTPRASNAAEWRTKAAACDSSGTMCCSTPAVTCNAAPTPLQGLVPRLASGDDFGSGGYWGNPSRVGERRSTKFYYRGCPPFMC